MTSKLPTTLDAMRARALEIRRTLRSTNNMSDAGRAELETELFDLDAKLDAQGGRFMEGVTQPDVGRDS